MTSSALSHDVLLDSWFLLNSRRHTLIQKFWSCYNFKCSGLVLVQFIVILEWLPGCHSCTWAFGKGSMTGSCHFKRKAKPGRIDREAITYVFVWFISRTISCWPQANLYGMYFGTKALSSHGRWTESCFFLDRDRCLLGDSWCMFALDSWITTKAISSVINCEQLIRKWPEWRRYRNGQRKSIEGMTHFTLLLFTIMIM